MRLTAMAPWEALDLAGHLRRCDATLKQMRPGNQDGPFATLGSRRPTAQAVGSAMAASSIKVGMI